MYLAIVLWQESSLSQVSFVFFAAVSVELLPKLAQISPVPVQILPEQIFTNFAYFVYQFLQVSADFVANGFGCVLSGLVAVGRGRQFSHFVSGSDGGGYFGSICASDFGVVCASDSGPNCAII